MLKVVVDANIWISALLSSKKALAIVHLIEHDQFQLIFCAEALVSVLAEVTDRPKFQTKIQLRRKDDLLELVREKALFVDLPVGSRSVCRDPKDRCKQLIL